MEEEGPRGDMTIQSGLSNSTESIDSMKALTAAIEAANAQVTTPIFPLLVLSSFCSQCPWFVSQIHGPASQHVSNSTVSTPTPVLSRRPVVEEHHDDYRKEALRKGKCLSIGIQVLVERMNDASEATDPLYYGS